jgi:hypothetical protein
MRFFSRRTRAWPPGENPLVPVVRPFSPKGKQSIYAAVNRGALKRRSTDGGRSNGNAKEPGHASCDRRAAKIFDSTPELMSRFDAVWNRLAGSDERCAMLLRDAIVTVGLFTEADHPQMPAKDGTVRRRYGQYNGSGTHVDQMGYELMERAAMAWPLWVAVASPSFPRRRHPDWR